MPEKNFVRLSVGGILKETFCFFKNHFKEIMKIVCVPAAILFICSFVASPILDSGPISSDSLPLSSLILLVGGLILTLFLLAQLMLSVSHLTVTGQTEKRFFRKYWRQRHAKIVGRLLLFNIIFLLIFTAIVDLSNLPSFQKLIVSVPMIGCFIYFFSRFALVIPATSVGLPVTLAWSWRQTRGYVYLLSNFVIIFLIPNLMYLGLSSRFPFFSSFLIDPLLDILCTIWGSIGLGLVYKEFESKGALLPG